MGSSQTAESETVAAARAGDEAAFAALVEPHRRELQVHCYRMLGSFEDSEDLVQETFLRAWRKRRSFQGRSSFRAWLYGIATNACLDALARRPRVVPLQDGSQPLAEVAWLQPYPDQLLTDATAEAEPEAEVVAKETIELAYIAAIQLLPPKQRAVLIARDVLGWSAAESASLLDISVAAVNSALQRARATMKKHLPRHRLEWRPHSDPTDEERALLDRYMRATAFGSPEFGEFRCVATRVNSQPAVACYLRRPGDSAYQPFVLDVLRIEGDAVAEVTVFPLEPLLDALGLPAKL
jgi:RNA polymerase sigma-70 factor (ECF subfamily)